MENPALRGAPCCQAGTSDTAEFTRTTHDKQAAGRASEAAL